MGLTTDLPVFDRVRERAEFSGEFYFARRKPAVHAGPGKRGEWQIYQSEVRGTGPNRSFRYDGGRGISSPGSFNADLIWAPTEAELREKLAAIDAGENPTTALVLREEPVAGEIVPVLHERRLELERAIKNPTISPKDGGIDFSNPEHATDDLVSRLVIPFVQWNLTKMEDLAADSIIHPVIYNSLKPEFDELFDRVKELVTPAKKLSGQIPEEAMEAMLGGFFTAARALVGTFLQKHANAIQVAQLIASNSDTVVAAIRALEAALPGNRHEGRDFGKKLPSGTAAELKSKLENLR